MVRKHWRFFSFLLLVVLLGVPGCTTDSYLDEARRTKYSYVQESNWAVLEPVKDAGTGFDIFYIYPTLISGSEQPVMNWRKFPEQRDKAVKFSKLQLDLLRAPGVGLFAPMVQQADLASCRSYLENGECDWDFQPTRLGIDDTVRAFRFYRGAYGKKRPFVLIGHSQGAVDLYRLLARCPEITADNGFVAAYLIGLPVLSAAEIEKELAANGIKVARGADDFGVVVGWNTGSADCKENPFCRKGGERGTLVVNPVSWSLATEPAEVAGAQYLDGKLELHPVADAFTATADPAHGMLRVGLPADSEYDNHCRNFGPGVMHGNDFFFFAPSIKENMARRVAAWRNRGKNPGAGEAAPDKAGQPAAQTPDAGKSEQPAAAK